MRYFAVPGESMCTTSQADDYTPSPGEIEMQGPRPSPEHVAQADGTWVLAPNRQRIAEIKAELTMLDQQLIRPMAEIAAGTADDDDREKFDALMVEKEKLREELRELTEPPKKKKKKDE